MLPLVLIWVGCEVAVIRPLDPITGKAVLEEVPIASDPEAYARTIWATQVPATVAERTVDLVTLLSELRADREKAVRSFGHREAGRPPSFLVFGSGRVARVDTASRVGWMEVDLEPADGSADVRIQIGPVIRGTALRDALPFVAFNTFSNQVAYAAVSRELHRLVADSVLARFDRSQIEGVTLSFRGAFTLGPESPILLTPVTLQRVE